MLCQHFMALWVTTDESDTPSSPVGPPHIAASLLTDGSLPLSIGHDQAGVELQVSELPGCPLCGLRSYPLNLSG